MFLCLLCPGTALLLLNVFLLLFLAVSKEEVALVNLRIR